MDFRNTGTLNQHGLKKRLVFYDRIKSCAELRKDRLAIFKISHKTLDRTVYHEQVLGPSEPPE